MLLGHIHVSKNGYRSNSSWVAIVITVFSILMFFTMFGHNSAIETYAIVFRRQKPSKNDHKIYVSKHVSSKSEKFQMGPRTIAPCSPLFCSIHIWLQCARNGVAAVFPRNKELFPVGERAAEFLLIIDFIT